MTANGDEKTPWWTHVDWPGAIAFVLAVGIACSMVLAICGEVFNREAIGQQGATILSTIFGAAIGAVATYLGGSRERQLRMNEQAAKTVKP